MPISYASFRVDPSIHFDNFHLSSPGRANSPTVSNFSRPISIRPALSPNASHLSFALSDSSRRSSYVSSKGPMTPQQEPAMQSSVAGPFLATLGDDHHSDTPSFMLDSHQAPKLDLSFAVESVMRTYQPLSMPSSPARPSMQVERERPSTAVSLAPAPVLKPMTTPSLRPCPVHGARRSTVTVRPCPIHGAKRASTMPLPPALSDLPRKSMSERPAEMQRSETLKDLPTLPFLQHDPFSRPSSDLDRVRPKSAGVDSAGTNPDDGDFVFDRAQPMKKQSAPSIMSTRSTRSIRKGFSKVRRMLARAKAL